MERVDRGGAPAASGRARMAAVLMVAGVLAVLVGVPLVDTAAALLRSRAGEGPRRSPAARLGEAFAAVAGGGHGGDSVLGGWALGRGQRLLIGELGAGSEKVLRGADGWLFYRPAVESLLGPGFLARPAAGAARRSDPRAAVLQFARQLAARGIRLVLLPAPAKATIHPEMLAPGTAAQAPLRNPSFAAFVAAMGDADVLVFDPAPLLVAEKGRGAGPLYLATDTHWRPRAVELVAAGLAAFVRENVELEEVDDPGYALEDGEVEHVGDLAAMLRLPADLAAFPPERVAVRQVVTADELLWRLDRSADVLLLGDSFTNVFSLAGLGWGDGAGLAEHLSHRLGRPLDVMTRNDDAAFATRLMLVQELARGRDRLAGKRVVVWELAERELALGDWRELPLELGAAPPRRLWAPGRGAAAVVTGTVLEVAAVPRPRGAPYPDHLAAVHLGDLESGDAEVAGRQAVVFVRTMVDYELTPAASWRPGQRVTLRLSPWADAGEELQSMMRSELTDPELVFAEPCWGEVVR